MQEKSWKLWSRRYIIYLFGQKKLPDYKEEDHGVAKLISIQSESTSTEKISLIIIIAENHKPENPIVVIGHGNEERLKDSTTYF